jgi:hypothetical protein
VKKNANYSIQKYILKKHHEDFSMIAMGSSCEYGNASLGLITNRYVSDYLMRFKMLMENPA